MVPKHRPGKQRGCITGNMEKGKKRSQTAEETTPRVSIQRYERSPSYTAARSLRIRVSLLTYLHPFITRWISNMRMTARVIRRQFVATCSRGVSTVFFAACGTGAWPVTTAPPCAVALIYVAVRVVMQVTSRAVTTGAVCAARGAAYASKLASALP